MTNGEKYVIEHVGQIAEGEQEFKDLQADMRKLPNFNGKLCVVAHGVTNRDFYALLKDRRTHFLIAYFGTMEGFCVWGKEPVDPVADPNVIRSLGIDPTRIH